MHFNGVQKKLRKGILYAHGKGAVNGIFTLSLQCRNVTLNSRFDAVQWLTSYRWLVLVARTPRAISVIQG